MDSSKFIELLEDFEEMNIEQKKWIYANLNHIIEKFNIKFNKKITVKFD